MAKNFHVYITTGDSEFSPVTFETVDGCPVPTNVLPHIKTLRMDVSNLDADQKRLLCEALHEAADFIQRGTSQLAESPGVRRDREVDTTDARWQVLGWSPRQG